MKTGSNFGLQLYVQLSSSLRILSTTKIGYDETAHYAILRLLFKKMYENVCSFIIMCWHVIKVVIKEKVLELLLYFTKHEDEEVKTKAIIGLGKNIIFLMWLDWFQDLQCHVTSL